MTKRKRAASFAEVWQWLLIVHHWWNCDAQYTFDVKLRGLLPTGEKSTRRIFNSDKATCPNDYFVEVCSEDGSLISIEINHNDCIDTDVFVFN